MASVIRSLGLWPFLIIAATFNDFFWSTSLNLQLFFGKVIIADPLPVLMVECDVIVDGLSILEMLVTWWTVIIFI